MTEEEAKTKWCPFARVRDVNNVSAAAVNIRSFTAPMRVPCIASECMAWRRQFETLAEGQADKGYCGLAGRPE